MTGAAPAYALWAPLASAVPLVLDSPHSGEHYPEDFDHAPSRMEVRQAEDTHVARLYRGAPALGATLLEAHFPRAYIGAPPCAIRQTRPIPCSVLRDGTIGAGHGSASSAASMSARLRLGSM